MLVPFRDRILFSTCRSVSLAQLAIQAQRNRIAQIARLTPIYILIFVPAFMWLWGVRDDISNHRTPYTKNEIVGRLKKDGYTIERATYANLTFFAPILAGRTFMKLTGVNLNRKTTSTSPL